MTDDEKVAQRYRELGAEEPPRALDEAILAAARREAGAGPAAIPLRSSRQRWYAPLATAAVLVLAVAVTLNMQHERPGIDSPAPQSPPPRADQPAAQQELKLKAEEQLASVAKKSEKEAAPMRRKDAGQAAPAVREPQPFAADRAAATAGASAPAASRADDARGVESSVTGSTARQIEERTSRDAEAAARAPRLGPLQAQLAKRAEDATRAKSAAAESAANLPAAPAAAPTPGPAPAKAAAAAAAEPTPERELERIADLRRQERHEEADKALAEFRKRHPDYRISGAMLERVERR